MPSVVRRRRTTYARRAKRLVAYRDKGWSWGAIAEKFGMHRANVRKTVLRELEKTDAEKKD